MLLDNSFNNTHYVYDAISWKSLAFISLQFDVVHLCNSLPH
jgi:cytochrome oxidase assembly protein ShyY1